MFGITHGTFAGEVGFIDILYFLSYAWDFRSRVGVVGFTIICIVPWNNFRTWGNKYRWLPRLMHGTSVPGAMEYAFSFSLAVRSAAGCFWS